MLISSEQGAAEILPADGDTRFYDDVGCMAADWTAHASSARAFVRLANGQWLEAGSAVFARPAGARTAMGSGVVAYATRADAESAGASEVQSFADVVRQAGAGQ